MDLYAAGSAIAAAAGAVAAEEGGAGIQVNLFWIIVSAELRLLPRDPVALRLGADHEDARRPPDEDRAGPQGRRAGAPPARALPAAAPPRRSPPRVARRATSSTGPSGSPRRTREADIAATREELERMRVRAAAEIEAEKGRAIADLRAEVADLALAAAGRVVGESMDGERRATARRRVPRRDGPGGQGLMARPSTAARRFAEAALELARRDGTLERWLADLRLAAEVAANPDVAGVLDNPAVPFGARRELLEKLLAGRVSPEALNLTLLLAQAPPGSPSCRRSRRSIERLVDRERGVVAATVTSAAPLEAARARGDRRPHPRDDRVAGRAGDARRSRAHRGRRRPHRRPSHRRQRAGTPRATPRPDRRRSPLTRPTPRRSPAGPPRATDWSTEWPSDPTRSSASSSPRSRTSTRPPRPATWGPSSRWATASPASTAWTTA